MKLAPYITYQGNCQEAIDFYKAVFDAEIVEIHHYGNSAMKVKEKDKNKILHVELKLGGNTLMASDASEGHPVSTGNNITMALMYDNPDVGEQIFTALASKGKVLMPFQDTFWGAKYGMVVDKFGINWSVNCELKK